MNALLFSISLTLLSVMAVNPAFSQAPNPSKLDDDESKVVCFDQSTCLVRSNACVATRWHNAYYNLVEAEAQMGAQIRTRKICIPPAAPKVEFDVLETQFFSYRGQALRDTRGSKEDLGNLIALARQDALDNCQWAFENVVKVKWDPCP